MSWFDDPVRNISGLTLPRLAMIMLGFLGTATPVWASQDSGQLGSGVLFRDDVAGTRTDPEFNLERIHVGSFTVDGSAQLSGGYDTNVFNQKDDRGDGFIAFAPRVSVNSDWSRNSLSLETGGRVLRQAELTSENSAAYDAALRGRLNLDDSSLLDLGVSYARTPEARGTGGVGKGNAEPVVRRDLTGTLNGSFAIGDFSIAAVVVAQTERYDRVKLRQGGYADQSFRDSDAFSAGLQGGVPLGTNLTGLINVAYDIERSPDTSAALRRDSSGITAQVGLRGYITQLVAAEIEIGLRTRNYELARFTDFSGLYYSATVDWYMLELISWRATAERSFANSGVGDSAGVESSRERLTLFYDPARDLRFILTGSHTKDRYRDADLSMRTWEAALTAQYFMSAHWSASLRLGWRDATSSNLSIIDSYSGINASIQTVFKF